jgi:hypothetical protein
MVSFSNLGAKVVKRKELARCGGSLFLYRERMQMQKRGSLTAFLLSLSSGVCNLG